MQHNTDDLDWLGLKTSSEGLQAALTVHPTQTNPTGRLYGGVAVAASIAVMEQVTSRSITWTTVQFSSSCGAGETIDLAATISASGRRTSQVRVTAAVDGRELFTALGATVDPPRAGATGLNGQWEAMPSVDMPDACPPLELRQPEAEACAESHILLSDMRTAIGFEDQPPAQVALWCRPHGVARLSAAVLGWQADMLGIALAKASGGSGGTSLDNTVRFGPPAPRGAEWVLLDMRGQAIVDGYGHGTTHLWAPDATLLATASQTCIMRRAG
ncbi:MAG: thioesterase family protein [Actinomycetota bacterium]|nr:thioesterase family protein [Actinomycetota bacterium]